MGMGMGMGMGPPVFRGCQWGTRGGLCMGAGHMHHRVSVSLFNALQKREALGGRRGAGRVGEPGTVQYGAVGQQTSLSTVPH